MIAGFKFLKKSSESVLAKTNVSNAPGKSDLGGNAKVGKRVPWSKYKDRIEVAPGVYKYDYGDKKEGGSPSGGGSRGPQPMRDQQVELYEQVKQVMMSDPFASRLTKFLTPRDYNALISIINARGLQPDQQTIMDEVNSVKSILGDKADEYLPAKNIADAFIDVIRKAIANPEVYIQKTNSIKADSNNQQKLATPDSIFYRTYAKMQDDIITKLKTDVEFLKTFKDTLDSTIETYLEENPQDKQHFEENQEDSQGQR